MLYGCMQRYVCLAHGSAKKKVRPQHKIKEYVNICYGKCKITYSANGDDCLINYMKNCSFWFYRKRFDDHLWEYIRVWSCGKTNLHLWNVIDPCVIQLWISIFRPLRLTCSGNLNYLLSSIFDFGTEKRMSYPFGFYI